MFFTNPLVQTAVIGAMLIAISSSLLGVFLFLKKRTLVSEVLSHAAFPGIIVGMLVAAWGYVDAWQSWLVTLGALGFALAGYATFSLLKKSRFVTDDASLSFVLASFFGIGILLLSYFQYVNPKLAKQANGLFFGQLATLSDEFIPLFVLSAICVVISVIVFYKEFKINAFDSEFAKSHARRTFFARPVLIEALLFFMVALITVIGIRTVGIVLVSALFIAPPIAARQYTNSLVTMLFLSTLFGTLSAWLGCYLSLKGLMGAKAIAAGPLIVVLAALFAFISLLCAPKRGLLFCYLRHFGFKCSCFAENLLKALWKASEAGRECSLQQLAEQLHCPKHWIRLARFWFKWRGWLSEKKGFELTREGKQRGASVVRLHRLWETYLVKCVGISPERVHKSAEEIEHILSPQLAQELNELLLNPTVDPHSQPIPGAIFEPVLKTEGTMTQEPEAAK